MIFDRQKAIAEAPSQRTIFEDFIEIADLRPNTALTYKRALEKYISYLEEKRINKPDEKTLNAYKKYLLTRPTKSGKSLSSATVQLHIVALRQFYSWCEEYGIYPNVSRFLHGVKVQTFFIRNPLTLEEANKLINYAAEESKKGLKELRDYTMIYLILNLGLRTVEASRADVDDIRKEGDYYFLYVQGKGKDSKDRPVRLIPYVVDVLKRYIKARNVDSGPLFLNTGNHNGKERIQPKVISKTIKYYLKAVGLDSRLITAHSLRHTCATLALANGASLEEVQQLLGHAQITTTTIYTHLVDKFNNKSQTLVGEVLSKPTLDDDPLVVDKGDPK